MEENNVFVFITNPEDIVYIKKQLLTEARVPVSGKIWEFHKTDCDPWPSTPHGHFGKEKLDPFTGKIYDIITKQHVANLSKSRLKQLQIDLSSRKDFAQLNFN